MGILDLILELKTFIFDSLPEDDCNNPCEWVKAFRSASPSVNATGGNHHLEAPCFSPCTFEVLLVIYPHLLGSNEGICTQWW